MNCAWGFSRGRSEDWLRWGPYIQMVPCPSAKSHRRVEAGEPYRWNQGLPACLSQAVWQVPLSLHHSTVINSSRSRQWTLMKNNKHLFPRLGLRSSPNQRQPSPPLRKKALLIGIQKRAAEDMHIAPGRKNMKAQKDPNKERAPEAPELKDPHRDVLELEQLLISAFYQQCFPFPFPC